MSQKLTTVQKQYSDTVKGLNGQKAQALAKVDKQQKEYEAKLKIARDKKDAAKDKEVAFYNAMAVTGTQKTAVQTYVTEKKAAIDERRATYDTNRATYQQVVKNAWSAYYDGLAQAHATARDAMATAVANAIQGCTDKVAKDKLTTYKEAINKIKADRNKAINGDANADPVIVGLKQVRKDTVKAALEAKQAANKTAQQAFETRITAAQDAVRTALGLK
jgi:hypothetical protein